MQAQLLPSSDLDRGPSPRTVTHGEPRRARAEPLRTPRCEPGGALRTLRPMEHHQRTHKAPTRAAGWQRSRSTVAGRHGYRALRHPQLRGLAPPRPRACLSARPTFFLTRPEGTPAAERLFGQNPRPMLAAIREAGEIPPAPLRPPQRAEG
jgi:hypothetical protein